MKNEDEIIVGMNELMNMFEVRVENLAKRDELIEIAKVCI